MSYERLPDEPRSNYVAVIGDEKDEYLEIHGYKQSFCKKLLFSLLSILTLGTTVLVTRWKPEWRVWLTCVRCPLSRATLLIIKDLHQRLSAEEVILKPVHGRIPADLIYVPPPVNTIDEDKIRLCPPEENYFRYFTHHCCRYVWDSHQHSFRRLRGLDVGVLCTDFYEKYTGFPVEEQQDRFNIYGPNSIDIDVNSYWKLFVEEVLNPFYIFQAASVILWSLDQYYYYASCIFFISIVSIGISLYETKRQRLILKDMVSHANTATVEVLRSDGTNETIPSTCLVPGDLIVIPSAGCLMACDAVLVAGNCLVNESMLTGESVPETKTPLLCQDDSEIFIPIENKRHILFSGTQVIQTRYYGNNSVVAVVLRTGFSTAKGELVRSILFPQPMGFKLYQDAVRFVIVLFCIASIGMGFSLYMYIKRNVEVKETIIRALDIVTIVVPPALPAAMTVGTVYAQNRLKQKGVFCISPPRINIGGKLKLVCFDKTGTLTEEGLDFWGVLPVSNKHFSPPLDDPSVLPEKSPLITAMATCHTLTMVKGELVGDPMDLNMFAATKWDLEEPGKDTNRYDMLMPTVVKPPRKTIPFPADDQLVFVPPLQSAQVLSESAKDCEKFDLLSPSVVKPVSRSSFLDTEEIPFEVGIVRQFPFSSSLQRMSVICRTLGSRTMDLYIKGAPEKIVSLCNIETVPDHFSDILQGYTLQGFRVLALAYRKLEKKITWHHAQRIKRDQVEKDLTFLGLLVMQNTLKPESTPVIHTLKYANIRTVMITGDNLLTAVSVARDCDMIPATDRIIIVKGTPPEESSPAVIKWEYAEFNDVETSFDNILPQKKTREEKAKCYINLDDLKHFHFAIDGRSFAVVRSYFPELYYRLIVKGTVFARMSPDQKTQLVESLQDIGYVVSMCGDGANDCGALKAADVGISLSEAEASVAAPFTSKIPNIECVPTVIKEGRCALVTTFSMFKFVSLYSLIQFLSVIILYAEGTNLSDMEFLYVDLFVITTLAVTMSYTEAYPSLVPARPQSSLISLSNFTSLSLHLIIVIGGQLGMILYLRSQSWYKPIRHDPNQDVYDYWDTVTIFFMSCYQYLIIAIVVSQGPPFQKPFWTNMWFLGNIVLLFAFTTALLFNPLVLIINFFDMVRWEPHEKLAFRATILLMSGVSFVLTYMSESYVANSAWLKRLYRYVFPKNVPKNKYRCVEMELANNPDWPLVSEPVYQTTSTKV